MAEIGSGDASGGAWTTASEAHDGLEAPVGPGIADARTAGWLRRYRRTGWAEALVGLAALVAAIAAITLEANVAKRLLETGARTPGIVTSYSPPVGRYNDGSFDVTYVGGGVTRNGVIHLDELSPSYSVGERVTVIYDRKDPTQIRTPREENEPPTTGYPTIIGLVGGVAFLIAGWVMIARGGSWTRVLTREPWIAYGCLCVRAGGRIGLVLTPKGGPPQAAIAIRFTAAARWRLGRLARAAPSTVWVAGSPQTGYVVALPSTRELFGALAPRGRTGKRFVNALRASGKLPLASPDGEPVSRD